VSTGRQKDQKDYDLEQIVQVIDTALESNDQRIKDALRALMTMTVLCTAEFPSQVLRDGPLARVFEDYHHLGRRLSELEDEVGDLRRMALTKTEAPFAPPYNPGSPFGPNPTTGWPGTNDPTKPSPVWNSTWSAGDDPNYKGASAEEFIKGLEGR
jgi:hypothetical protein